MRSFLLVKILVAVSLFSLMQVEAQNIRWLQEFGGTSIDYFGSLNTDNKGNIYVVGSSLGVASFGAINYGVQGEGAEFVVKYNSNGDAQWVRGPEIGYSRYSTINSVAADADGNVYIGGVYEDSLNFEGVKRFSTNPGNAAYIASYDSTGTLRWVVDFDASNGVGATLSLDVERVSGDVLVGSGFGGILQIGNISLPALGSLSLFTAKFDYLGNFKWARIGGGSAADEAKAVNFDSSGNCLAFGDYTSDTARFGSDTLFTLSSGEGLLILKYNPNGNFLWAKSIDGIGSFLPRNIATDSSNNVYIIGRANDSMFFDGLSLWADAADSMGYGFIAKYSPLGNPIWVKKVSSPNPIRLRSIGVKKDGTVYIGGSYRNFLTFADTVIQGPAGSFAQNNLFLAELDPQGNTNWVRFPQSINTRSVIYGIALDHEGEVLAGGDFSGTLDFNPPSVTSPGSQHMFISKWYVPKAPTGFSVFEREEDISIYPNPAENEFFIQSKNENLTEFKLFDLTGKIVQHGSLEGDQAWLSLHNPYKGVLILEAQCENGIFRKKILFR